MNPSNPNVSPGKLTHARPANKQDTSVLGLGRQGTGREGTGRQGADRQIAPRGRLQACRSLHHSEITQTTGVQKPSTFRDNVFQHPKLPQKPPKVIAETAPEITLARTEHAELIWLKVIFCDKKLSFSIKSYLFR